MGIDFSRLGGGTGSPAHRRLLDPRDIFSALPDKNKGLDYLRGPQDQVLAAWHKRRAERDLVLKMNTGGGKTFVGLLVAQSWLNEGIKPVGYFVPNRHLVAQVTAEADRLGIQTTDNPRSTAFSSGQAVLVSVFTALFNGRSVFGVAGSAGRTPACHLGALVIDDAHACLLQAEDVFRLRLNSDESAFATILDLFEGDLRQQSENGFLDLKDKLWSAIQQVPYWAWYDRQDEVLEVLRRVKDHEGMEWAWPLLVDLLPMCRAVVTGDGLEVKPPRHPTRSITGFDEAERRLYLTATLADDSVLVRDFGVSPDSVATPIVPNSAGDIGDRLILVPQELFPEASEDEVRQMVLELASEQNVVVIVPSRARAAYWRDDAALVLDKNNIDDGIAELRSRTDVGLVVLVNRYDGVDLPDDACHVLVLDGLPEALAGMERLEQAQLSRSRELMVRQLQRLEQGMGRATRSNEDHCVVILLGAKLVQRLHAPHALDALSPATRAQMGLAAEVADVLRGGAVSDLMDVITQCLGRDKGWVALSRGTLAEVRYETPTPTPSALAERQAFEAATIHADTPEAIRLQQEAVNEVTDADLKAYLQQQLAAYTHPINPARAQEIQRSTNRQNRNLLRPLDGVQYERLTTASAEQAADAATWLQQRYESTNELILGFQALLSDLVWGPRTKQFEQAWADLAWHIGLAGQQPERDIGQGPDVLWALPDASFVVVEVKSESTDTHPVYRKDAEQLSNSVDWFKGQYPSATYTPLLVHPQARFDRRAAIPVRCRVVTTEALDGLRDALDRFSQGLAHESAFRDQRRIGQLLASHGLTASEFFTRHTVPGRQAP